MKPFTSFQELDALGEGLSKDYIARTHRWNARCFDIEGFITDYLGLAIVYESFAEKDSSKSLDTMNLSGNSLDDSTMNLSVKEEKARRFLPCVEKALSSDCMEGRRNKTAFLIASSLIQRKMERVKIKELILRWNRNLSEPMGDNEAENVIIKAFLNNEKGKNHYGCGVFQAEGLCVGNCSFRTMNLSGKGKTE